MPAGALDALEKLEPGEVNVPHEHHSAPFARVVKFRHLCKASGLIAIVHPDGATAFWKMGPCDLEDGIEAGDNVGSGNQVACAEGQETGVTGAGADAMNHGVRKRLEVRLGESAGKYKWT
jgi:hypothetical protein